MRFCRCPFLSHDLHNVLAVPLNRYIVALLLKVVLNNKRKRGLKGKEFRVVTSESYSVLAPKVHLFSIGVMDLKAN